MERRLLALRVAMADQGFIHSSATACLRHDQHDPLMAARLFAMRQNDDQRNLSDRRAWFLQDDDVGRSIPRRCRTRSIFKITASGARMPPSRRGWLRLPHGGLFRDRIPANFSALASRRSPRRCWSQRTRPIRWRRGSALGVPAPSHHRAAQRSRDPDRPHPAPPFEVRTHARYIRGSTSLNSCRASSAPSSAMNDADLHRALGHAQIERAHHGGLLSIRSRRSEIMLVKIGPYVIVGSCCWLISGSA